MTSVDSDIATTNAHDPSARRRTHSARSPSLTRSSATKSLGKRSLSPIVAFNAASLSPENPKGVQKITRKVIKKLEGLGHEAEDMEPIVPEEEDSFEDSEDAEVEQALYAIGQEALEKLQTVKETNGCVKVNGSGPNPAKPKPDFEIPRKILHSSIGFFTLYLYISEGNVQTIVMVLWMALAVIVPADLLRFGSKRFARLYENLLGFLMRESEKNSINGVVWYILGVNFALTFYPQDVATVAILILSWADTAASTFGRLYGSATRKLPARLPIVRLPLAPRKSVAGFMAATVTGAAIAWGFWGYVAPVRAGGNFISWTWEGGVRQLAQTTTTEPTYLGGGGAIGLFTISIVAGLISGVAEALDLGSLDDNLTLPIISGGCLVGFLKVFGYVTSYLFS